MSDKNITEVYFSPAGSVKTITDRTASSFQGEKTVFDLLKNPKKLPVKPFSSSDCLIVGMPVFSGRIPDICAQTLKKFKGGGATAIAIVVYGNRDYEDALLELKNILEEAGFIVIAAAAFVARHSIFPTVAANRPDEKDFKIIDDFASKCAKTAGSFTISQKKELNIKGSFPYREPKPIPLKPSGNSKCNTCGACSKICPVGAIDPNKPKKTNEKICISCAACIYACARDSRNFHGLIYRVAKNGFEKKCAEYREPEIFD